MEPRSGGCSTLTYRFGRYLDLGEAMKQRCDLFALFGSLLQRPSRTLGVGIVLCVLEVQKCAWMLDGSGRVFEVDFGVIG